MVGHTKQSGKKQAPIYSLTGRSKIGSFHEDLKKVGIVVVLLTVLAPMRPTTKHMT